MLVASPASSWHQGRLTILSRCPQCGAEIRVSWAASGVRCRHCGTAHLLASRAQLAAFCVRDRLSSAADAHHAVIEDLRRRHAIEGALAHASLAGPAAEAYRTPDPGSRALDASRRAGADAWVEAEAASWASQLEATSHLIEHSRVLAPYLHLSARVWEGAVERRGDGRKHATVEVRRVELSCPVFSPGLELPGTGELSAVTELVPVPCPREPGDPVLPVVDLGERLDALRARAMAARHRPDCEVLARQVALVVVQRCLVLRPFHVITLELRGTRRTLLVDGAGRTVLAQVEPGFAARVLELLTRATTGLETTSWSLQPMRCPSCAGPLPLRTGDEVHFCRTCGRAFELREAELRPIPYRVELPAAASPLMLPFWRIPFALCDPRDGQRIASLAELRARLSPSAAPVLNGDRTSEYLDIPAFRHLERCWPLARVRELGRRTTDVTQALEGPLPHGVGTRRPSRLVAIGSSESLAVARLALLMTLTEHDLVRASPWRIKQLLFGAPLELGSPRLVLRGFASSELGHLVEVSRL